LTKGRLFSALAELVANGGGGEIVRLRRLACERRSTFPLEQLQVELSDGSELRVAFKRLERRKLSGAARLSKPSFVFDAAREPAVYSRLLALAPPGTARFIGSVKTDGGAGRWLFVEWVDGQELHQVGDRALWVQTASWLGRMHASLASDLDRHLEQAHLLEHDATLCTRWVRRAARIAKSTDAGTHAARFLGALKRSYDKVVEELLALPRTVIHGDFYPSNVLVGGDRTSIRLAPVDWEMAALAPGLLDLAALTSGGWEESERMAMIAAYMSADGVPCFSSRDFAVARLHHAIQRLGWAPPPWRAPPTHRYDWLGDAIGRAEELGI
jgi:hypothetical protein